MKVDDDFFGIQHAVQQQQKSEVEPSSSRTVEKSGTDFFDEAFFPEISKNSQIQSSSNDVIDHKAPQSGTEFLDEAFFSEIPNKSRTQSSPNDVADQKVPQSGTEYLDETFFGNRARSRVNENLDPQNSSKLSTFRRSKIETIDSPYIQVEDFTGLDKLNSLVEPIWKYSSEDLISLLAERVVYDGDDIIAFDKPYQMAYASGPKSQPQMDRLLQDLKKVVAPKVDRLYVIKSLDKACSGVIMFAKSADLQKKYQEMIQKGRIEFEYRTIVKNVPKKSEACINIPLRKFTAGQDFEMRPLIKPTKDKVHYVKTNYNTIENNDHDHCAYLRVNVTNEIPHQIRSHLGYGIGCPVLGDKKYNNVGQKSPQTLSSGILSKFQMKQSQVQKMPMFLHLKEIHLDGVTTRHKFNASIRAPTPEFFKFALKRLSLLKK